MKAVSASEVLKALSLLLLVVCVSEKKAWEECANPPCHPTRPMLVWQGDAHTWATNCVGNLVAADRLGDSGSSRNNP